MIEVSTYHCHICKQKFEIELEKGGICDNCKKPTCNKHFASKHEVGDTAIYICSECFSKSNDI